MNTALAFALGEANRGREQMVFDWDKAAKLIKKYNAEHADAGLRGDWEWTGGEIWDNGKPIMCDYTYLASTWATPEICIDGIVYECYKMQSEVPDWNSDTKWPSSALGIVRGDVVDV